MTESAVRSLRFRYIIGLTAIALLVTASWVTLQTVVSRQENYGNLIGIAGDQRRLVERIALFSLTMATTQSELDFRIARNQLGQAINRLRAGHILLVNGNEPEEIPYVMTPLLESIYFGASIDLQGAIGRYIDRAWTVYNSNFSEIDETFETLIFIQQYGPHAISGIYDDVIGEYERVARDAILSVSRLETILWAAAIIMLIVEVILIFRPMERQVRGALGNLRDANGKLAQHVHALEIAKGEAEDSRKAAEVALAQSFQTNEKLERAKLSAEQANHAKSEFLAMMSHDLRTPLNAIIGFSEMMIGNFDNQSEDKRKEYLRDIRDAGNHLLSVLNDLLDVSKIDAGGMELSDDIILPCDEILAMLRLMEAKIGENKLALYTECHRAPEVALACDLRIVRQMLLNLISNAVKFTPDGGSVGTRCTLDPETGCFRITVWDTGPGMTDEEIAIAANPFEVRDARVVRRGEMQSTGLGLYLVDRMMQLHGGSLDLLRRAEGGLAASMIFPAERIRAAKEARRAE